MTCGTISQHRRFVQKKTISQVKIGHGRFSIFPTSVAQNYFYFSRPYLCKDYFIFVKVIHVTSLCKLSDADWNIKSNIHSKIINKSMLCPCFCSKLQVLFTFEPAV